MVRITCNGTSFGRVQAIVFDKDGTLANSEDYLFHLGHRRAQQVNLQIPGLEQPLLRAFGIDPSGINPAGMMAVGARRDNLIAAAGYVAEAGRAWVEALDIVQAAFQQVDASMEPKTRYTPLFLEGRSLLQRLHGAGFKLGLLSSDTTENVMEFIRFYQLEEMFRAGLGVNGRPPKPDPATFYAICAEMDVHPQQTLVVGDAASDLRMAALGGAAGSIGVTWGWKRKPSLPEAGAIAHHFDDILAG